MGPTVSYVTCLPPPNHHLYCRHYQKKKANNKLFDLDSLILFIGSLLVYPKIHSCAKKGVCVW